MSGFWRENVDAFWREKSWVLAGKWCRGFAAVANRVFLASLGSSASTDPNRLTDVRMSSLKTSDTADRSEREEYRWSTSVQQMQNSSGNSARGMQPQLLFYCYISYGQQSPMCNLLFMIGCRSEPVPACGHMNCRMQVFLKHFFDKVTQFCGEKSSVTRLCKWSRIAFIQYHNVPISQNV